MIDHVVFAAAAAAGGGTNTAPNYLGYVLVFILTGALTGYLGAGIMPGRAEAGRVVPAVLGLIGGLVGGIAALFLISSWPRYVTAYQPGYEHHTALPAYWISPIFAFVLAMLVLAAYKLTDRDPSVA